MSSFSLATKSCGFSASILKNWIPIISFTVAISWVLCSQGRLPGWVHDQESFSAWRRRPEKKHLLDTFNAHKKKTTFLIEVERLGKPKGGSNPVMDWDPIQGKSWAIPLSLHATKTEITSLMDGSLFNFFIFKFLPFSYFHFPFTCTYKSSSRLKNEFPVIEPNRRIHDSFLLKPGVKHVRWENFAPLEDKEKA